MARDRKASATAMPRTMFVWIAKMASSMHSRALGPFAKTSMFAVVSRLNPMRREAHAPT